MTITTTQKQHTELVYQLKALGMAGTVLHLGAHPDDEDVGLMAYMARKMGVRIVYWSATRGEGGENRIGPYEEESLGVYRTWESLEARAVDGGEAMFGPFYDYGYSKFGDEALEKWGRDNLIREIVRVIRYVQPDVVVSRWSGQPQDGHGHHLAIGDVTPEAFHAAGNPQAFPALNLPTWQPRKLYQSVMGDWSPGEDVSFGQRNPDFESAGMVRLNTGWFDAPAGLTYQEQAWMGFNSHKTQAMGFAPAAGDFYYYYRPVHSETTQPQPEDDFFAGFDPTLTGLAHYPGDGSPELLDNLATIKTLVQTAFEQFRVHHPLESAEALLVALSNLKTLHAKISNPALFNYLARKITDFETVITHCLGLRLECLADTARVCPTQEVYIAVHLWNHQQHKLGPGQFKLQLPPGWKAEELPAQAAEGDHYTAAYCITIPEDSPLAHPYWLTRPRQPYAYIWPNQPGDGLPFGPPQVTVACTLTVGKHQLTLTEPAVKREAFVGGFRELPVSIVPPISLHPRTRQELLQLSPQSQTLELQVVVRSNTSRDQIEGDVLVEAPPGWQVEPAKQTVTLGSSGDARTLRLSVTIPGNASAGSYTLKYGVQCGNRLYDVVLEPVRMVAPGLPGAPTESNCIKEEFVIRPADVKLHLIEAKFIRNLKYAYIKGPSEEILESLAHFNLDFHLISDEEIGYLDLEQFDAVIAGPDAYLVRNELCKNNARFLEYVNQGGTLIVLRQGYAYAEHNFAPYPIGYNQPNDEVTFETAPVTHLLPQHSLLNLPNLIDDEDFARWVKDRGNFFLGKWDSAYHPLLSCHDPGESPKAGGLVSANYGRGVYVYCAYSLFRQLPAGVPGAFRLFANLLAQPVARILEWAGYLKRVSLFSYMDDEQLQALATVMTEHSFAPGDYICRQDEPGDELYVVLDGEVEVVAEANEQTRVVSKQGAGDIIGEIALLSQKPRTASLRAKSDVRLLTLTRSQFQTLTHQQPEMLEQVIVLLVEKLSVMAKQFRPQN